MLIEIGAALVGLVLLWLLARAVRGVTHAALSRRRIDPQVVVLFGRAAFVAVIGAGLFVGSAYFGQGALGASGLLAATIVAALGIQDILKDYVSGLYLLTERRLNIGDQVEFGSYSGTIIEIRFRVTYVRAEDGSLVVAPNSELFNSIVVIKASKVPAGSGQPAAPKAPAATPASRKPRA